MSNDPPNAQRAQANDLHTAYYKRAEATLQQAATQVHQIFREIKGGYLQLTTDEAATMQMEIQELVLQAAALGGVIREQQTGQGQMHPMG